MCCCVFTLFRIDNNKWSIRYWIIKSSIVKIYFTKTIFATNEHVITLHRDYVTVSNTSFILWMCYHTEAMTIMMDCDILW